MFNGTSLMNQAFEGLIGSFMRRLTVVESRFVTPKVKITRLQGNLKGFNFQLGDAVAVLVGDRKLRNYTAAFVDLNLGFLDIVAHIHGNGPASHFFEHLQLGAEVQVSIPRGKSFYDASVKKQVFFGDETALGFAVSLLPFFKKHKHDFHYCFELEAENKNSPALLGLSNYTVFPKDGSLIDQTWMEQQSDFCFADWQSANFIITGNVNSVQTLRKLVKNETLANKIYSKGYWLAGKKAL